MKRDFTYIDIDTNLDSRFENQLSRVSASSNCQKVTATLLIMQINRSNRDGGMPQLLLHRLQRRTIIQAVGGMAMP
jgi:hypothetical protein